jgi:hypothetical protein
LDIDAEMMDPTTLVIGTDGLRTSRVDGRLLSEYLDCGGGVAGPNADNYDVTLSVFVQLEGGGSASTRLRTVLDASAQSRYNLSDQLQCASIGTLERLLVARIDRHLTDPGNASASRGPLRRPMAGDFVRLMCTGPVGPTTTSEGELLGVKARSCWPAPGAANARPFPRPA